MSDQPGTTEPFKEGMQINCNSQSLWHKVLVVGKFIRLEQVATFLTRSLLHLGFLWDHQCFSVHLLTALRRQVNIELSAFRR